MTLTNYWWLLIWMFGSRLLFFMFPCRLERLGDTTVKRWSYGAAILVVLPYIIWAGYRKDVGDTYLYTAMFENVETDISAISKYFSGSKDPGYSTLSILFKSFVSTDPEIFFLAIAAFQMLTMMWVFRKYSTNYWISIFLFIVSTDYVSWMLNGMRQFLAVMIIFAGFTLLLKKKYIPMLLLVALAAQIHASAWLMVPIIFIVQGKAWNTKTLLMLAATALGVVFIDQFTTILDDLLQETQYSDLVTGDLWASDDGTNIIRVVIYSVPALLSVFGLRYVRAADDPVINLCVNCSIATMALYIISAVSSGVYVGRLPIYTTLMGYIALPWLIDHIFTEQSAKLVRIAMVFLYSAFFYYQMGLTWGML